MLLVYRCVCVCVLSESCIYLFFFYLYCNNLVCVTYLILGSYPMLCVKSQLPVLPLTAYVDLVSPSCILHTVWHIGRSGPSQHTCTLVSE